MVRRVYTAHDRDGKSYIAHDQEASSVHHLSGVGLVFHELWRTAAPLASNEGMEDPVPAELSVMPDRGGTTMRIVELLPSPPGESVEMHVTPTTDYNVVLQGTVQAVSDSGAVEMCPGDVLVQRGGRHGWRNNTDDVCVFASVVVYDR